MTYERFGAQPVVDYGKVKTFSFSESVLFLHRLIFGTPSSFLCSVEQNEKNLQQKKATQGIAVIIIFYSCLVQTKPKRKTVLNFQAKQTKLC